MDILKNYKNILLGSIYRPPNSKCDWYGYLEECIEKVYDENKHIMIMGDFNIDLHLKNNISQKLLNTMESFGLCQLIKDSTRVTSKSSTLIDHMYVTESESIRDISVPQFSPSDHYPICCTWNVKGNYKAPQGIHKSIRYRSAKNFNKEQFLSELMTAPWYLIKQCYNVDESLDLWMTLFNEVLNNHLPIKERRIKHTGKPEWINEEILNAIKQHEHFRVKDNTKYKFWRNKVVLLIKNAKALYYQKLIEENKKNPKELWKIIKSVNPKKSCHAPNEIVVNNRIVMIRNVLLMNSTTTLHLLQIS